MGWSLPGDRLICLQRDNLKPELFEKIISPSEAWRHAEQDYIFDDSWYHSHYIAMMELKSYGHKPPALHYGTQAKRQLQGESLLFGPSGKATKLETSFEIMPDGSRRFITTIPKEGKR